MKKFQFDSVGNFDSHISNSIHGYDLLDSLIMNICSFFAKNGETILDLGCSSGRLLVKLKGFNSNIKCIGYDIIDHNFLESKKVNLKHQDITDKDFNLPSANIIMSIFTLQFLIYRDRVTLLKKIYDSLNRTGVFIVCEKEISSIGIYQDVFTFANYDYKKSNFTSEEILQKEFGLRTIMNCLSSGENERMFKESGFTRVESFFQSLNFRGWLCMK